MTRFLRLPEVVARTGLSPMTLWRREHANPPTFPPRVRLGANCVGWPEHEVEGWIEERIAERDRHANEQRASATERPDTAERAP